MINPEIEERNVEYWERGQSGYDITIADLVTLAVVGFERCDDKDCHSRRYSGEDRCKCIRSVFPHPVYYDLYLELRDIVLQAETYNVLMESVSVDR